MASGVAELAGGLAVLPARTRPAARWWLLATLLAVYWANIHMALRPEKFPRFKPALLWARLPGAGPVRLAHLARDQAGLTSALLRVDGALELALVHARTPRRC